MEKGARRMITALRGREEADKKARGREEVKKRELYQEKRGLA